MTLLDLFFPPRCVVCDRPLTYRESGVCKTCAESLHKIRDPRCMKCGKELSEERDVFCKDCTDHAHRFESCRALFLYDDAMKKSIYRFKYDGRKEYAAYYAKALSEELGDWIRSVRPNALIPIPLHPNRLKKRGYNQAELIAGKLSALVNVPVKTDILIRRADTKRQKELNLSARENNLKKAFKTSENDVKLDTALLVDDIYTTGATMDAAAACLKGAGVSRVYALTLSIGRNT